MDINPNFILTFLFLSLFLSSQSLLPTFANDDGEAMLSFNEILPTFANDDGEAEDETPFNYKDGTGKGPKDWGRIDPHWKACNNGKLQSPIDLLDKRVVVLPNLGELIHGYKSAPAVLKNRGHDIAVEWQGDAGKIVINNTAYNLLQCHWHTPSEHTLNGARYEQELHIVHKNSLGGIAVIGILYKFGRPDPFLQQFLEHIKTVESEGVAELGSVNPEDIKFGCRKYYRYIGSLTVPPCTEGVIWTVLNKIRTVSREQVRALREAVHDGFEENSRPTQENNGRQVYFYRPKA